MIFSSKKTPEKNYRFKELKVYSSTEWLADGKKKYQTVFEGAETTYVYVELSFYNRQFDEADWEANVKLKCFRLLDKGRRDELCDLNINSKISKDDVLCFVREGWGNKEKGFWTRGDYVWEVRINDDFVGKKLFYIEEGGPIQASDNPYFELEGMRLYEGPNEGCPADKRVYGNAFNCRDARYIWAEFNIENMQTSSWYCELFFNFYNEAGMLKGRTTELKRIDGDDEQLTITTGWGSDTKGSWHKNRYTIEVIFLGRLIAVLPFEIGDEFVEGDSKVISGEQLLLPPAAEPVEIEESLEELLGRIDRMVGLAGVKKRIRDYVKYLKFTQLRKKNGFKESKKVNLHTVFKGNPGTGKTTIAKMLGKIYCKIGMLSTGEVHEVGRAELIGQYIGQTAPKVKEVIEKARGGVLFIDEAYSLVRNKDDNKDYGQEVIETLIKEMSDGPGDIAIVMAGYPKGMNILLDSNPGLKSRIGPIFTFQDFVPQELFQIAEQAAEENEIVFLDEALSVLRKKITENYRERDESFGNARMVHQLIEETKMSLSLRVMSKAEPEKLEKENLQLIEKQDVDLVFKEEEMLNPHIAIDTEMYEEALEELNGMIGLSAVKEQVSELAGLVRFYRESGRDVLKRFSLHTIFKGNPGTGKTTVARILAKIYRSLGILERGHLVECDRQSLVAGFVGQTAGKTKEKIEQATGGVLFIDEAYSLNSRNDSNDFGKEALEIIIKEMEDQRGEFIVIAAGYPENMDTFTQMNPGLKSRFDQILNFEDFSPEELYEITVAMFAEENLEIEKRTGEYLLSFFTKLHKSKDKYFGNGRAVRKLVSGAVRRQHLRMAGIGASERSESVLKTLIESDLADWKKDDEHLVGKNKIGFRSN